MRKMISRRTMTVGANLQVRPPIVVPLMCSKGSGVDRGKNVFSLWIGDTRQATDTAV